MTSTDRLKALLVETALEGGSVVRVLATDAARVALRELKFDVDVTQDREPTDRGWSHPVRGGLVVLWRRDEFEVMGLPVVQV